MRSALLSFLLFCISCAALAVERVNVTIEGLSRAHRKNLEHHLDIERRRKDENLTAS